MATGRAMHHSLTLMAAVRLQAHPHAPPPFRPALGGVRLHDRVVSEAILPGDHHLVAGAHAMRDDGPSAIGGAKLDPAHMGGALAIDHEQ